MTLLSYRAHCTSAAPVYSEPYTPGIGELCLAGGLCANNPVQLAVKENVYLNGENVPLVIDLSVGSGQGDNP